MTTREGSRRSGDETGCLHLRVVEVGPWIGWIVDWDCMFANENCLCGKVGVDGVFPIIDTPVGGLARTPLVLVVCDFVKVLKFGTDFGPTYSNGKFRMNQNNQPPTSRQQHNNIQ